MRLEEFDYYLPEELIAQSPLEQRDASRLLHLPIDTGVAIHRKFAECVDLLEAGDLLVMNDTRVSAIRLIGQRATGGATEALLLRETSPGEFLALAKPAKRLRLGTLIDFGPGLQATVTELLADGQRKLTFCQSEGWRDRLEENGSVPLPPYIHEKLANPERYQTVVASVPGSAAAPTAGLHFTESILEQLKEKGIDFATVTLDVGIDTFRPVTAERIEDHQIHGETCSVSEETAAAVEKASGRIVAVGTTSVRTLETFAQGKRRLSPGSTLSTKFITPGYDFKVIDGMFTNFHLPKTSMLFMVAALVGIEPLRRAYEEAVKMRYRFLSFGDSMLIL
ncbi:tRNA preQ1(34) S-adenosylmethionine ribosyltransferase-isomerase QueA [Kamptonema cortianum]|nr:tRNA preQ1(34) S-adenosylmethionine ribosyltransferase-isomerase QueA [Geitlerinema splendidum]MDK3161061.1 tRNA preQ1(34) S-adenosylmethionine ribosyltransferase-isomerase QueA [Kamptonema cortianum]